MSLWVLLGILEEACVFYALLLNVLFVNVLGAVSLLCDAHEVLRIKSVF